MGAENAFVGVCGDLNTCLCMLGLLYHEPGH